MSSQGLQLCFSPFMSTHSNVCSGDFTLYDHVLDHSVLFGVVPKKYSDAKLSHLDLTFAMGRGRQRDGVDGAFNRSALCIVLMLTYLCTVEARMLKLPFIQYLD